MKTKLAFALLSITLLLSCSHSKTDLPYSEDFENTQFPPPGWQTFPVDSPNNWIRDTTASAFGLGKACASFNNCNSPVGIYRGIRLPFMNFTGVKNPYMRFDIAYALSVCDTCQNDDNSDTFGIWWGTTDTDWQNVQNYSGASLASASPAPCVFLPSLSQWQTKTVALTALANLPKVRLAIEDDCNGGNKIYFDNVLVFDSVEAIK